nr:alpha-L-fucosidase [Microbacterium testaceum]
MVSRSFDRRSFLGVAGASAMGALLPTVLGGRGVASAATVHAPSAPMAAPQAAAMSTGASWDTQALLSRLVDHRFGMFNHFNLGTFTDEEWAAPNQNPATFAPPKVDTDQWADAAKAAGMSYGVLTTKHHDGFALWPTKYGSQNVANSGYQQDVVRQYVDSFRSRGLAVGFYFSIWDRTYPVRSTGGYHVSDPTAGVDPAQLDYVFNQVTELLTNYGEIELFMLDGYAWQTGHQQVSMQRLRDLVKTLQPNCVMVDICAVTTPWLSDAIFWEEPLGIRVPAGNTWGGLQGQTVSNGWFWHPSTPNEALMSVDDIVSHIKECEQRWTSFILNCAPNRNGELDANVVARLAQVGGAWAPDSQRGTLPQQPLRPEYPITPVAVSATAYRDEEPPYFAIDGRSDNRLQTCWSTWPGTGALAMPVSITLDLGGVYDDVTTFEYLPKQWARENGTDGDITSYDIETSVDGRTYTRVATGTWPATPVPKLAEFPAVTAAYVRFTAKAGSGGYTNVNDLHIGGRLAEPVRQSYVFAPERTYTLTNPASSRALTEMSDGSVRLAANTGAKNQQWVATVDVDGYYTLTNAGSGRVLEISGRSRSVGAAASAATNRNVLEQHWAMSMTPDGTALLTSRFSMHVLGLPSGATAEGTRPVQQQNRSLAHQKWTVTDVSTKAVDVVATAGSRCIANKVYVTVSVRNADTVPAEVVITTPYGTKAITVEAGKTVSSAISTRKASITAGTVTVAATAPDRADTTLSIPLSAASCS